MNTPKKLILSFAFLLFFSSVNAQYKTQEKQLNAMIIEGMKEWKIPGLAAIVVKDGKVVYQKNYGIKDIKTNEKVDKNTLFNMASTTKALIAISIGMLVDQHKLNWEDKVRTHLPSFQLSDPYITADARVKDLLSHNLGIGNADLLWAIDSTSTQKVIERFRLAKTTYPLRGGFTYQNIMYAIAGTLIEEVTGQHWTTFVEQHIFKPLEMTRTQAKSIDILKVGNYATPHVNDVEEGVLTVDYTFSDQIGAAGMIWSSANDISNYLTFLVNNGVYKGDTLLQPSTFDYLFRPEAILNGVEFYPTSVLTHPSWTTYGLGWFQHDYRGKKLDFHTGSISGLVAIAGLMRSENLAVYVFANLDHAELRHAIMYKAIDLYAFEDNSRKWHREVFDLYEGFRKDAMANQKKEEASRVMGTSPSLALDEYAGVYINKMYGQVKITVVDNQLQVNINDYVFFGSEHWHYDTFISDKDPNYRAKWKFNFTLNTKAKVQELNLFGETFIKEN